jgi:hypothetical protein
LQGFALQDVLPYDGNSQPEGIKTDNIEAYSYSVEAKVKIVENAAVTNLLAFPLTCKCATNGSIPTRMLYPCCIWSHRSPQDPSSSESNAGNHPSRLSALLDHEA